jgi:hypothetical protein
MLTERAKTKQKEEAMASGIYWKIKSFDNDKGRHVAARKEDSKVA